MPALLITGSDTSVGKTLVTSILASYWLQHHAPSSLGIFKPVQTGYGDREYYQETFQLPQTLSEICPQFFSAPLAPPLAAAQENKQVDLALLWQQFQKLQAGRSLVLVEAAGGIGSPITWEYTVADLARDWQLPTILVVPIRLGSMTQAVTASALARLCKVDLRGIVFSCAYPSTATEIDEYVAADRLPFLTQVPILGIVPYLENINDHQQFARIASTWQLEYVGL